jgi:hypothetical protein
VAPTNRQDWAYFLTKAGATPTRLLGAAVSKKQRH